MDNNWKENSWRNYSIRQQPVYPDLNHLNTVIGELKNLPSLVFSGETRLLKKEISGVNAQNNFILQIGNCAESFEDCHGPNIHNFIRILFQMSKVIEFKTGRKVIKIGRVAGQYAKPRSSDSEVINGVEMKSYRGDNVNGFEANEEERNPNPELLKEGYFRSAATLNLIRAFIQGGYSAIENIHNWEEHLFSKVVTEQDYYQRFVNDVTDSLKDNSKLIDNKINDHIFVSHEGLLLDYEQAFTRPDTTKGGFYDTSAHFLWIGDRTRQLDSAHVEFFRGVGNPIGIKVGPNYNLKELIAVFKKLNYLNEDGKLVIICRFGVNAINILMPALVQEVIKNRINVTWICDPMHGNTYTHNKLKVRAFDDIVEELKRFFHICKTENIISGGVHLEITEQDVTECVGGVNGINLERLNDNYTTKVDPRLNAAQALELAFVIGEVMQ